MRQFLRTRQPSLPRPLWRIRMHAGAGRPGQAPGTQSAQIWTASIVLAHMLTAAHGGGSGGRLAPMVFTERDPRRSASEAGPDRPSAGPVMRAVRVARTPALLRPVRGPWGSGKPGATTRP